MKNYLGKKVNIKILPELSDLGHTIYFGLKDAVGTVIINFADTIVLDSVTGIKGNAFFCQEDYMSDTWTYFDEKGGTRRAPKIRKTSGNHLPNKSENYF